MRILQERPKASQPVSSSGHPTRPAGDAYEKEADHVAELVVSPISAVPTAQSNRGLRRYSEKSEAPASVRDALTESGKPLEPELRSDMERRFHYDFSHVRVHASATANDSARDLSADAYTAGNHVVFAAGRFAPRTHAGKRLLAHELTHVVQQSGNTFSAGSPALVVQRQPVTPPAVPAAKAEPPATEEKGSAEKGKDASESSPLRKELFKLFDEFEKKVVGDEKFEPVTSKKQWDNFKNNEAIATEAFERDKEDYAQEMEAYKRGELKTKPAPPVPVAKFTKIVLPDGTFYEFKAQFDKHQDVVGDIQRTFPVNLSLPAGTTLYVYHSQQGVIDCPDGCGYDTTWSISAF